MNAKAGNDKENDDGRSTKDDGAPAVGQEAADGSGGVDSPEEGEHAVVADGNPKGEDEAESIENGITGKLVRGRRWSVGGFHEDFSA